MKIKQRKTEGRLGVRKELKKIREIIKQRDMRIRHPFPLNEPVLSNMVAIVRSVNNLVSIKE